MNQTKKKSEVEVLKRKKLWIIQVYEVFNMPALLKVNRKYHRIRHHQYKNYIINCFFLTTALFYDRKIRYACEFLHENYLILKSNIHYWLFCLLLSTYGILIINYLIINIWCQPVFWFQLFLKEKGSGSSIRNWLKLQMIERLLFCCLFFIILIIDICECIQPV